MLTIGQWWRQAQQELEQRGLAPAPREARAILQHVLQADDLTLLTTEQQEIISSHLQQLTSLLNQRLQGHPLAYVLGGTWFMQRWWGVSPAVLIPRPDSETLVHAALAHLPLNASGTLAEVGLGSGALLGTLLLERPQLHGLGIDLSALAILQAGENFTHHGLGPRAQLRTGNLFTGTAEFFDLILSNPPYVSDTEWAALEPGVKDHEPKLALVGAATNPDGLRLYRDLLPQALPRLHPSGWLLLEIGWQQADSVQSLFTKDPRWQNVHTLKDLAGRNRVIAAQRHA